MTASENITRAEAKERSALVEVQSYEVVLDVTSDGPTFSTVTTVTFTCRAAGRVHVDRPHRADRALGGAQRRSPRRVGGGGRTADHPARPAGRQRPRRHRRRRLHEHRRGTASVRRPGRQGDVPLLAVRVRGLAPHVRLLRAARPEGRRSQLTVTAPSHWKVVSNSPTPEPAVHGDGTATWAFEPTPRISTYITALVAGPYHRVTRLVHGPVRHLPARRVLPRVARAVPRLRRDPHRHEAGLRVLRGAVRRAPTRSPSTTSSSCRSSTPARWRTPAASPSSRTTSSGRVSRTRPTSSAPTRSCTSSRTCGSATSSR